MRRPRARRSKERAPAAEDRHLERTEAEETNWTPGGHRVSEPRREALCLQ